MSAQKKFLRRIQEDCFGRALSSEELASVAIILVRKALTASSVEQQLKTLKGRNGKAGICVFVEMPSVDVPAPNVPGPATSVVQTFLVLEHPSINESSVGTGSDAENVSVDLLQLFHQFIPYGVTQVMVASANAIVPDNSFDGLVGYTVTLTTEVALKKPSKVLLPKITSASAVVPGVKEVSTIDVTGFDQSEYFTLADADGPVYVWLTIDGNGSDPAPGGRGINAGLTLGENPTPETIAIDLVQTLNNDGAFIATRVGAVVTITDAAVGARTNIGAGTSGCAVAVITQGQNAGTGTGWDITLTCATPGATIRYTIDGSYPGSGNAAALTYSAPFNLPAAATLRVGAEKAGMQPSDISQEIFS